MAEAGIGPRVIRHGNLNTSRDMTDAGDSAPVVIALAEKGTPGEAYNIGSAYTMTIFDLLQKAVILSKVPIRTEADQARFRLYDEKVLLADNAKIRRLTGWKPSTDMTATVGRILEFWRRKVSTLYGRSLMETVQPELSDPPGISTGYATSTGKHKAPRATFQECLFAGPWLSEKPDCESMQKKFEDAKKVLNKQLAGTIGGEAAHPAARTSKSQPLVAIIVRAYSGRRADVMASLPCYFAMVPQGFAEAVIVLDDTPQDRFLKHDVEQKVQEAGVNNVRVVLEPDPSSSLPSRRRMFVGNLEGHAGKDRSQFSNFWMSNYTSAQVIAFSDSEVCMHFPLIPPVVFDMSDAANPRLRNVAHLSGDGWGPDPWVLGHETPLETMLTDRFPIFIWREHVVQFRHHVAQRFGYNASAYGGDEAAAFNEAFTDMTNSQRRWGKYQYGAAKRWGWSQFNLFSNFVFSAPTAASRYVWHTPTEASQHLPVAKTLPGWASVSTQPWLTIGMNHGQYMQHSKLGCCAMFPEESACASFRGRDFPGQDGDVLFTVSCLVSNCPNDFRCKPGHKASTPEWPPKDKGPCPGNSIQAVPVEWAPHSRHVLQSVLMHTSSYAHKMPEDTLTPMRRSCFPNAYPAPAQTAIHTPHRGKAGGSSLGKNSQG